MSDAYAIVDIPKSLPIHGMALTSTGRKIEHILGRAGFECLTMTTKCEKWPQK